MITGVDQLQKEFAGRYAIERELGRGGMATVYLARDQRHNRSVAIKVFSAEYGGGGTAERFRSEIEIAAALAHPGIVPVFDSGAAGEALYYVMPYIEGESLRALLSRQPRLTVDQTLRIARDSSDVEAWGMLAYVNLDFGWQFGRGEREVRAAVEQGLRLDSTDVTMNARMAWLTVATNDSAGLEVVARRLRTLDTTVSMVRGTLRSLEAVRASDARFDQMLDGMRTAPIPEWVAVLRTVRLQRPDRAELLSQRLHQSTAMDSRRTGLGSMVQVFAAEARWDAIDSLRRSGAFKEAAGFDRMVDRLTVAAAIGGVTNEATGQRAAAALAATLPPDSARAWFQTHSVWLEGWLIGAWNAMYGDSTLARRWDAALGTLPKGGSPPEYVAALRADISSRLAARRGDRQAALRDAKRALELWTIHTGSSLELMPEPAMRFQLASLLRATASADSAATLFRSMVPPNTWLGFYTARAALELGELADARGDHIYAERQFLIALKLWERGDSIVSPFRDRARHALARSRS